MVKAIFFDIDGTLRDERRGVPESAVKAVRMCRAKGIQAVICTGRNMASIQPDVLAIETDGIIAGGGCLIRDRDRVWRDTWFQYEEIKDVLKVLIQKKFPLALESQEHIFMNGGAGTWFREDYEKKLEGLDPWERQCRIKENGIAYRDNLMEFRPQQDHIHKICIWSAGDDTFRITAMAEKLGTIAQQGSLDEWRYLEAVPKGCTKGAALREWCGLKNIDPNATMSFGDGRNDKDMLMASGIGVAMEDGDEELKACASSICRAAMADGIYRELLERGVIGSAIS